MAAESSAGCELSVSGIRVLIVCAPRKGKMNTPGIRRGGCDGIVSLEIPAQLFGSLQSVQPCFSQVSTEKSIGRLRKRQIKNPLSSTGSELVFPPAPAQNTVSPNFSRGHPPACSVSDPSVLTEFPEPCHPSRQTLSRLHGDPVTSHLCSARR